MDKEKEKLPLSTILLWGVLGSGKTLAALSTQQKPIVIIDTERSSKIFFEQMEQCKEYGIDLEGALRIECLDRDSLFEANRSIKSEFSSKKKIGTLIVDTYSWAEDKWQEWFFNKPENVEIAKKQSGLVWGAFKTMMRKIILEWMSISELLILTSHARTEYIGNAPSGSKEVRCGETAKELSEMIIMLHRQPNSQLPDAYTTPPRGKSRILGLPPVIPQFTIHKLRDFIRNPRNWDENKAPEETPLDLIQKTKNEEV